MRCVQHLRLCEVHVVYVVQALCNRGARLRRETAALFLQRSGAFVMPCTGAWESSFLDAALDDSF